MRLYLVRHGEALPREKDPERGLSDRGRKDAEKTAAFLKRQGVEVEAVWESGKKRAAQTAEIMAAAVTSREGIVRQAGMSPNDPVTPIIEKLAALDGDHMLVGHLPFLSTLVSHLILGREEPEVILFRAAAAACLEQGAEGRWLVGWAVSPDLL